MPRLSGSKSHRSTKVLSSRCERSGTRTATGLLHMSQHGQARGTFFPCARCQGCIKRWPFTRVCRAVLTNETEQRTILRELIGTRVWWLIATRASTCKIKPKCNEQRMKCIVGERRREREREREREKERERKRERGKCKENCYSSSRGRFRYKRKRW